MATFKKILYDFYLFLPSYCFSLVLFIISFPILKIRLFPQYLNIAEFFVFSHLCHCSAKCLPFHLFYATVSTYSIQWYYNLDS